MKEINQQWSDLQNMLHYGPAIKPFFQSLVDGMNEQQVRIESLESMVDPVSHAHVHEFKEALAAPQYIEPAAAAETAEEDPTPTPEPVSVQESEPVTEQEVESETQEAPVEPVVEEDPPAAPIPGTGD